MTTATYVPTREMVRAVNTRDVAEVRRLLAMPGGAEMRDRDRRTGLHAAAAKDDVEIARILLAGGVPVNARDSMGDTALHYAVAGSNLGMVRVLVAHGACPNCLNKRGSTPLSAAATAPVKTRSFSVIDALLGAGGDVDLVSHGVSVRSIARERDPDLAEFLANAELAPLPPQPRHPDPVFTTQRFHAEAGAIWRRDVPPSGEAPTVSGEMLRVVEKLRDEAFRNGYVNYGPPLAAKLYFVRDTLLSSPALADVHAGIAADVALLDDARRPCIDDAPYDRLADCVVRWEKAHGVIRR